MITSDVVEAVCASVRGVVVAGGWPAEDAPASWRDTWSALGSLGVLDPVDEGTAVAPSELTAAIAAELGGALFAGPYPAVAAALRVARAGGTPPPWVDAVAAGAALVALVDGSQCAVEDGRITGTTGPLAGADRCHEVLAATADGRVAHVVLGTSGVTLAPINGLDTSRALACVELEGAEADIHPVPDPDGPIRPLDYLALLTAADTLGGVSRALSMTVDYARQREAFGAPIGRNQAVAHRLVDHTIWDRCARALMRRATRQVDAGDRAAAATAASTVAFVNGHAAAVHSDLIQLTGAVGFTWDHGLHHFLRRATEDAAHTGF